MSGGCIAVTTIQYKGNNTIKQIIVINEYLKMDRAITIFLVPTTTATYALFSDLFCNDRNTIATTNVINKPATPIAEDKA